MRNEVPHQDSGTTATSRMLCQLKRFGMTSFKAQTVFKSDCDDDVT